jgi:hypothetical protein
MRYYLFIFTQKRKDNTMEHYKEDDSFLAKVKQKGREAKRKVSDVAWKVTHDPQTQKTIVTTAIVVGTVAVEGARIKKAFTPTQAELEERRREKSFYDRSTGLWYDTRRKLTNEEVLFVRSEVKKGRTAMEVLQSIGLARR